MRTAAPDLGAPVSAHVDGNRKAAAEARERVATLLDGAIDNRKRSRPR